MRKHPSEIADVPIDFASRLALGETITSATAAVVGTASITVGATPTVASPVVTARVSGGTEGQTDSFLVLATTDLGQVLPAVIDVLVTAVPLSAASYSTPEQFATRIGPRVYAQLTAESGDVPDVLIAQGWLTAASVEIDIRIGNRYVVPVTAPAAAVVRLGGLEEQIALWFAYVYRAIGEQESAASAAKVGYDAAMKLLDAIAAGDIDLTGAAPRPPDVSAAGGGASWKSNTPLYTNENFRVF